MHRAKVRNTSDLVRFGQEVHWQGLRRGNLNKLTRSIRFSDIGNCDISAVTRNRDLVFLCSALAETQLLIRSVLSTIASLGNAPQLYQSSLTKFISPLLHH